jgi:hypothetical protein
MYPCNFVSYLRSHYSMKENVDTFEEVVKVSTTGHAILTPSYINVCCVKRCLVVIRLTNLFVS